MSLSFYLFDGRETMRRDVMGRGVRNINKNNEYLLLTPTHEGLVNLSIPFPLELLVYKSVNESAMLFSTDSN
jgi:hypothetical protein